MSEFTESIPKAAYVLHARITELEEREAALEKEINSLRLRCRVLQSWVDILSPVGDLYVAAFKGDEKLTMVERFRMQEVENALHEITSHRMLSGGEIG